MTSSSSMRVQVRRRSSPAVAARAVATTRAPSRTSAAAPGDRRRSRSASASAIEHVQNCHRRSQASRRSAARGAGESGRQAQVDLLRADRANEGVKGIGIEDRHEPGIALGERRNRRVSRCQLREPVGFGDEGLGDDVICVRGGSGGELVLPGGRSGLRDLDRVWHQWTVGRQPDSAHESARRSDRAGRRPSDSMGRRLPQRRSEAQTERRRHVRGRDSVTVTYEAVTVGSRPDKEMSRTLASGSFRCQMLSSGLSPIVVGGRVPGTCCWTGFWLVVSLPRPGLVLVVADATKEEEPDDRQDDNDREDDAQDRSYAGSSRCSTTTSSSRST